MTPEEWLIVFLCLCIFILQVLYWTYARTADKAIKAWKEAAEEWEDIARRWHTLADESYEVAEKAVKDLRTARLVVRRLKEDDEAS